MGGRPGGERQVRLLNSTVTFEELMAELGSHLSEPQVENGDVVVAADIDGGLAD